MTPKPIIALVFGHVIAGLSSVAVAQDNPNKKTESTEKPNYSTTDIEFKAHDGVDMFGRIVLPDSTPPRAIVIAVQAAEGATVDMRRSLGDGKTFNYYDLYRKHLAAKNIGFFSYEGRGIRMGDEAPRYETIDWKIYNTSTLDNKVQDVLSAIDAVRNRSAVADAPIFLLGASEGTLIAAEAASRKPDKVAGLVLYGVLVTNLRETFRYIMSDGAFLRYRKSMDSDNDNNVSKEEWDAIVKGAVEFSKADQNGDGTFNVEDVKIGTQTYLDAIDGDDYEVLQAWAAKSAAVSVPERWFKDHFAHEANAKFLLSLDIPIACFHGDMDAMTPVSAVKELQARAKDAKLDKMEFHYFEGLDHSLNIANYFVHGEMPAGHRAIFEFIDRVAPNN